MSPEQREHLIETIRQVTSPHREANRLARICAPDPIAPLEQHRTANGLEIAQRAIKALSSEDFARLKDWFRSE